MRAALCAWVTALGSGALAASNTPPTDPGGQAQQEENIVEFEVTGLRSTRGEVVCALYRKRAWLKVPHKLAKAQIRKGRALCRFDGVKPGVYAAGAYHDENANQELDQGAFGIPTEGWCLSRNATASLSAPDFKDARFRGGPRALRAKIQY